MTYRPELNPALRLLQQFVLANSDHHVLVSGSLIELHGGDDPEDLIVDLSRSNYDADQIVGL